MSLLSVSSKKNYHLAGFDHTTLKLPFVDATNFIAI
jgi:hypothetical protein